MPKSDKTIAENKNYETVFLMNTVVGWMVTPQWYISVYVPESVNITCTENDVIIIRVLREGIYPELSIWALNAIPCIFKREE